MEKDILILLAGIATGAMNAIAGGGMLIGFPAMVALGVPPLVANISANAINPPGMAVAIGSYRSYLRRVPRTYIWLLLPVFVGSLAGALLLRQTGSESFAHVVPWLVLLGVVLFAFQPIIHLHLHHHIHHKRGGMPKLALIGLGILPASVYGGYFGAGFGFMMLAFLGMGKIREMHMLAAMKNISSLVVCLVCLAVLIPTGLVDWSLAAMMASGTAVGGYLGASIGKKIPSHWLRVFVIIIGLTAAIHLALRDY
ncbi:hypothetical protein CSA80_03235 [Candidatus Saccharibacteria bacterium]|nr:MAG: hypothetical protein CSA80_03235 [Candidatus Saccharibacteria bacterium]